MFVHYIEKLLDVLVGHLFFGNRDELRRVEDLACQLFDGIGHRSTEKQCLAISGQIGKDLFNIVQKSHIEHLVRFVQDYEAWIELHFAAFKKIEQPAWRGHHDAGVADMVELA